MLSALERLASRRRLVFHCPHCSTWARLASLADCSPPERGQRLLAVRLADEERILRPRRATGCCCCCFWRYDDGNHDGELRGAKKGRRRRSDHVRRLVRAPKLGAREHLLLLAAELRQAAHDHRRSWIGMGDFHLDLYRSNLSLRLSAALQSQGSNCNCSPAPRAAH